MWLRNLVFLGLLVAGVGSLAAALFPTPTPPRVRHFNAAEQQAVEFRTVVDRVDSSFRKQWQELNLRPAQRADDLVVLRGELEDLDALKADDLAPWWTAHARPDQATLIFAGKTRQPAFKPRCSKLIASVAQV